jgi:ethanolamine utilization cobalamin adenosyltransferase
MLFDRKAVEANIRNRDGKRVFYLGKGHQLTSDARDYLQNQRIEILPAELAKPEQYRLLGGGFMSDKPEHMTHLNAEFLVCKTHPRIRFRGAMDMLEAEILLCQQEADPKTSADLNDALELARKVIRWDVLDEPAEEMLLGGLDAQQLRERSHRPQDFYGQPHFMPDFQDSRLLLMLNHARCAARQAELVAVEAFADRNGVPFRTDILQYLNRLSSFLYLLMIREKSGGCNHGKL